MTDALNFFLLKKIKDVKIINQPYPHFIIDDFFPQETYLYILRNIPDESKYKPFVKSRLIMELNKTSDINLKHITDILMSEEMKECLLEKYKNTMSKSIYQHGKTGYIRGSLIKDFKGYSIKPHTDIETKIITFLIYLPNDDSLCHIGTNILIKHDIINKFDLVDKFDFVDKVEFLPNRLFCFLRTFNSWHSVDEIEDDICRNTINMQIHTDTKYLF